MRKDKGLNGDLDRLPMLTWIMFLKFLDDMERIEETKAALAETDYRAVIDPPYRWRDWAAPVGRIDRSLISSRSWRARKPNVPTAPGDRASSPGSRTCVATAVDASGATWSRRSSRASPTVWRAATSCATWSTLVDGIRFHVSEEVHTLGRLYETLLREMRDAAGDAGEFYTPRPVVRFMVEVTDPQLGETVLDPACGTGGFLTESFDHLMRQAKDRD